jgi:hypothetical protein
MEKYYTPEIEEFHVGFEYQSMWGLEGINAEWHDEIYSEKNSIEHLIDSIRVKYLDKKDIESFGFGDLKKSVCNWYLLEGVFEDGFASYGVWKYIRLQHDVERNKVAIRAYEYSLQEEEVVLFQGSIRNKSELKRLLKQLNIIK